MDTLDLIRVSMTSSTESSSESQQATVKEIGVSYQNQARSRTNLINANL
jgi:hypothetical protein